MTNVQSTSKKKSCPAEIIVKVNSTFSNTIIAITTKLGEVVSWSSSGKMGFKGSKKATAHAAKICAEDAAVLAKAKGAQIVDTIKVSGPGPGRESAIKEIASQFGGTVKQIIDVTPVAHNGTRPPKERRV